MNHPPAPVRVPPSFEEEFPGASALATECMINLLRTADLILGEMSRWLRPLGLSPTAAQILTIIEGAGEPLPPHVIGERLLVTSGTMTSLLDTLEKRGLVRRIPHPEDRRKLLVEITPEAQRHVDDNMPRLHARARVWMQTLTTEQQAELVQSLGKVQEQLYALRGQPFPEGQGRRKPQGASPPEEEPIS